MDERIRDVFATVLGVPREIVIPEATPATIAGWDSLAHLSLVSEFERVFGVSLTMDEVLAIQCVGDFESHAGDAVPPVPEPGADGSGVDRMLPSDRDALFAFASRVATEITLVHSPEHWKWQYLANPNVEPRNPPVYLFRHEGHIAGHLGTIPVQLEAGGRTLSASWSAGLVSAPEVRSRGAGVRLIERWTRDCDVSLVLGTTPDAEGLFTELGWLRPAGGHVRSFMRLLDTDAVVRKHAKNPLARKALRFVANAALSLIMRAPSVRGGDLAVSVFDRFDSRFDTFWERVRAGYPIIVRRDRRYLQWKFASQPGVEYIRLVAERTSPAGDAERVIAGYAVLRVMKRKPYVAYLVDLLAGADDDEAWLALIGASLDVLMARGVQQVWCVVLSPVVEAHLRKMGFILRDSPMTFFVHPNRPDLDPGFFAEGSNWFVTKGDADQDRP